MGGPPAFVVDGVDVVFGGATVALREVSLSIKPGEAVAIVGPSGSGKTTLLRLLNGSIRPTIGEVRVQGRALCDLDAHGLRLARAAIGFVHQDLRLVPNIRVLHNVITGRLGRMSMLHSLRSALFPPRALQHEVYELLERVGIPEELHERTDRLSGGQRQRVAIARALFQQPWALLADEPVSSVDPSRARDAVRLLSEISGNSGLTLCVSLHNLELAREFFPRLVGLRGGRIVFDQKSSELSPAQFQDLYQLTREEILDDAG